MLCFCVLCVVMFLDVELSGIVLFVVVYFGMVCVNCVCYGLFVLIFLIIVLGGFFFYVVVCLFMDVCVYVCVL